jgi:hypothetical protein
MRIRCESCNIIIDQVLIEVKYKTESTILEGGSLNYGDVTEGEWEVLCPECLSEIPFFWNDDGYPNIIIEEVDVINS